MYNMACLDKLDLMYPELKLGSRSVLLSACKLQNRVVSFVLQCTYHTRQLAIATKNLSQC